MTPSTSAATLSNPELSAEELDTKLFSLIKGIATPHDLSKANLEHLTGLRLTAASATPQTLWTAEGSIRTGGRYVFGFDDYSPDDRRIQVKIASDQAHLQGTPPPCTLDFQRLQDRLRTMGYQDNEMPGPHGKPQAWQFWKGRQSVLIDYGYNAPPSNGGARCVSNITIETIMT